MPVIFQKTLFLPHKVIIPGNKMCLDTFSPDIRVNFLLAPFIVVASLFLTVFFSGFATASPELLKAARQVDMSGVQTQLTRDAGANPIPYPQILAECEVVGLNGAIELLITHVSQIVVNLLFDKRLQLRFCKRRPSGLFHGTRLHVSPTAVAKTAGRNGNAANTIGRARGGRHRWELGTATKSH